MLIFDIGSNQGDFAALCCDKYDECKVIAVDANGDFESACEARGNVEFVHKLVAKEASQKKEFYIDPHQNGISSASRHFMTESRFAQGSKNLPEESGTWDPEPITVETTTLDDLIEAYGEPDFIKIDVEGYEYEVLCGLSQKVKSLCFEWHEEMFDEAKKCVELLKTIGFSEFALSGYFDEGDIFEKVFYDERGDNYNFTPDTDSYYPWEEIEKEKFITPERRVNYGMLFAR